MVQDYLRNRSIIGPIPPYIRYGPTAPRDYDHRQTAPAMVAMVTSPAGQPCGLHITSLTSDGSKAFGARSRLMFGDVGGGAVRLGIPEQTLGVAEGIETALSFASLTGMPTWAALSASGLAKFHPPGGVETLVIAADGDDAGLSAAHELIQRARRRCDAVLAPAPAGFDWNDVLTGRA